ncbi:MAG: 5'-methylthioadenosine/S-adenosylhomocysteine nucleosidase [Sphaerochaeta sp.]|jgi:adenosylhomocysteine/aminodeoxyfutalosine nucleosidase|nr:5'-methylthioadenosine/S-adenosylhomocysteine nucleosidase [Sphaerochaeta sp.]MCH3920191.1 5'-methylthioadenosine/S-adenosylhomocysteine nucleosidase [Sphaerochaeta sp.]MCI2045392.1 5'-methylthioadenosine/S-adenosylhomocysteine nucleosidase [Sphaerochaeta sp.]MCI2076769.1 5'-methylthioadenosine/S-adenosylhomocysteine nucleosidase [Sphaerochaeta sp.]MCI2096793.1 5'-methylthioadenosine/S-adenosylhomocysteine nucleosidase [Sphaerochaeta sp.]
MKRILVVAASAMERNGVTDLPSSVVGVGKVQSAVRTLEAIQTNSPDLVVCVGFAGALSADLNIGDVVVGTTVCQYDIDLTAFKLKRCTVPTGEGMHSLGILSLWDDPRVEGKRGPLGTADRFVTPAYRKDHPFVTEELGVIACDMESYAVAYAASRRNIPCMVARVISDDWEGRRPKNLPAFLRSYRETTGRLLSVLAQ